MSVIKRWNGTSWEPVGAGPISEIAGPLEIGAAIDALRGNGMLKIKPIDPAGTTDEYSGIILERPSATWGSTAASGAADFAEGQFIAIFQEPVGGDDNNIDALLFRIDKFGGIEMAGGIHLATDLHGEDSSIAQAIWTNPSRSMVHQLMTGTSGQAHAFMVVTDNLGNTLTRIDKEGRLGIKSLTAPADGDVTNSEFLLYLDATPGAPKLMAKGKDQTGTVYTKDLFAGGSSLSVVSKTNNYTATTSDDVILGNAGIGSITITLPAAATATKALTIKRINTGANTVTVDGAGAETIDGAANYVLQGKDASITLVSDGTGWQIRALVYGEVDVPITAGGTGASDATTARSNLGAQASSVISSNGKGFVNHGSTAGTARPSGFASIEWYGSVQPTNAVVGDTWIDTT